jgi:3D (Asp-Asp-Asp) domain-containing protein
VLLIILIITPIHTSNKSTILLKNNEIYKEKIAKIKDNNNNNTVKTQKNASLNNNNIKKEEEQQYKVVIMEVTAYTLNECGKSPDDKYYGITASGTRAREYRTVAASRSIPFGTRIKIPAFEEFVGRNNIEFVVEDRGGAITEGKLDVYVSDVDLAKQWGRRKVEVIIYGRD